MPAAKNPLILVVDDDRDTRDLYRVVFEFGGYRVADAGGVAAAMRLAHDEPPDVVVTDWKLPDGRGIDVCERLRTAGATRRAVSVAVTGFALDVAELTRLRAAGCERVLLKPVEPEVMVRAVRDVLSLRAARELRRAAKRVWWYAARMRRQAHGAIRTSSEACAFSSELLARAGARTDPAVAFVLADNTARYVAASVRVATLTGYEPNDLLRLSVWDLTPLPNVADGHTLWDAFIARGTQEGEYSIVRGDGRSVAARYCAIANVVPGLHLSALAPR